VNRNQGGRRDAALSLRMSSFLVRREKKPQPGKDKEKKTVLKPSIGKLPAEGERGGEKTTTEEIDHGFRTPLSYFNTGEVRIHSEVKTKGMWGREGGGRRLRIRTETSAGMVS